MASHIRSHRAPCSCFPKRGPFSCCRNVARSRGCKSSVAITAECSRHHASRKVGSATVAYDCTAADAKQFLNGTSAHNRPFQCRRKDRSTVFTGWRQGALHLIHNYLGWHDDASIHLHWCNAENYDIRMHQATMSEGFLQKNLDMVFVYFYIDILHILPVSQWCSLLTASWCANVSAVYFTVCIHVLVYSVCRSGITCLNAPND